MAKKEKDSPQTPVAEQLIQAPTALSVPQEFNFQVLSDAVSSLAEQINKVQADLSERIGILANDIDSIRTHVPLADTSFTNTVEIKASTAVVTDEKIYPVPVEYRNIVNEVLNKEFGVTIDQHSDAPVFTFTIVVPDKYSSMTPSQREINKVDLRPKVLSFAEGINGVKDWATKVFENFIPETRAQIVNDRNR